MGKRRKKYKKVVKRVRKIPSIFQCPHCGKISLTVEINKDRTKATIQCGNCGLQYELDIPPIFFWGTMSPDALKPVFVRGAHKVVGGKGLRGRKRG